MKKIQDLLNIEPIRLFLALRVVAYLAAGVGLFGLSPEHAEQIGALLAVVLGVDVATAESARQKVMSPVSTDNIVAGFFITRVGRYIRSIVEAVAPQNRMTEALALVAPLALEYAQSELNDANRAMLQRRVHEMLRAAKIVRGKDLPAPDDA